ncbi:hypothetical protein TCAL_05920, partial [Tigriopus californicus]
EVLRALEARTSGAALSVVEAFRDSGEDDVKATVSGIWTALSSRFGRTSMIMASITNRKITRDIRRTSQNRKASSSANLAVAAQSQKRLANLAPNATFYACPIHVRSPHRLEECKTFGAMTIKKKEEAIRGARLCFRCLGDHMQSDCKEVMCCEMCSSFGHLTIMHRPNSNFELIQQRGSKVTLQSSTGSGPGGQSCGKTGLVEVWHKGNPKKIVRTYAILDEKSTSSCAHPKCFDSLAISGPLQNYRLTTFENHSSDVSGMIVSGIHVRGVGKHESFPLPPLPENSTENATNSCQVDVIELADQHGSNFKLISDAFFRAPDDEQMGTLQDDRRFLEFAKQSLTVNGAGFLSLKLLFRDQDPLLSNNREPVKCRSIDGTTYVDFDFSSMQSTLGVYWDLLRDEFMVQSNILDRPFTKRGILGVVNPPYNGIVFVSPEILGGRLLQRQIIPSRDSLPDDLKPLGWDNPLPKHFRRDWDKWKQSLNHLYLTKVPSPLRDKPLPCDSIRELKKIRNASPPNKLRNVDKYDRMKLRVMAQTMLIKDAQQVSYHHEITLMSQSTQLPPSHCLASLAPFLDENQIIRVGGSLGEVGAVHKYGVGCVWSLPNFRGEGNKSSSWDCQELVTDIYLPYVKSGSCGAPARPRYLNIQKRVSAFPCD